MISTIAEEKKQIETLIQEPSLIFMIYAMLIVQ